MTKQRRSFPTKLTASLPPAYTRSLQDTDLGIDVFPVSPGRRILVAGEDWAAANPDPSLVTERPMTAHAGVMLALDQSGARHRIGKWEFSLRSAGKGQNALGDVKQAFDVLGYKCDAAKSTAKVIGRIIYEGDGAGSATITTCGEDARHGCLPAHRAAIKYFAKKAVEGLLWTGFYGNKEIQRMVGATCTEPSRLGGRRIAQNRFFVQHVPSMGEMSPARRFLKVAQAIEQTFEGYTVLTSPVSQSYESVRAMLSGVVEAVASNVHRGAIRVDEHIEDVRLGRKQRNQAKWRQKFQEEMADEVKYLDNLLAEVGRIQTEAKGALSRDVQQSYDELVAWASNETDTLRYEAKLISVSLSSMDTREASNAKTPTELRNLSITAKSSKPEVRRPTVVVYDVAENSATSDDTQTPSVDDTQTPSDTSLLAAMDF